MTVNQLTRFSLTGKKYHQIDLWNKRPMDCITHLRNIGINILKQSFDETLPSRSQEQRFNIPVSLLDPGPVFLETSMYFHHLDISPLLKAVVLHFKDLNWIFSSMDAFRYGWNWLSRIKVSDIFSLFCSLAGICSWKRALPFTLELIWILFTQVCYASSNPVVLEMFFFWWREGVVIFHSYGDFTITVKGCTLWHILGTHGHWAVRIL